MLLVERCKSSRRYSAQELIKKVTMVDVQSNLVQHKQTTLDHLTMAAMKTKQSIIHFKRSWFCVTPFSATHDIVPSAWTGTSLGQAMKVLSVYLFLILDPKVFAYEIHRSFSCMGLSLLYCLPTAYYSLYYTHWNTFLVKHLTNLEAEAFVANTGSIDKRSSLTTA